MSLSLSSFLNNTSTSDGGSIYLDSSNLNLINVDFLNDISNSNGGSIFSSSSEVSISGGSFGKTSALIGGSIYAVSSTVSITGC